MRNKSTERMELIAYLNRLTQKPDLARFKNITRSQFIFDHKALDKELKPSFKSSCYIKSNDKRWVIQVPRCT